MPSPAGETKSYSFVAGLITDQSPLAPVPNSALDNLNYEIETDGSIRRRKGIRMESGGGEVTTSETWNTDAPCTNHLWRGADGNPDRNVLVVQVQSTLLFFEESDKPTQDAPFAQVLLSEFTTDGLELDSPVTMAAGKARLLIAHRALTPLQLGLQGDDITVTQINIRMRDFEDIDDGTAVSTRPVTLTQTHAYNLYNRGWTSVELSDFYTDKSVYPARNMQSWLGYAREVDVAVQEGYGTKVWSSDKMAAEVFGAASAPRGHLILDAFDTATALNIQAIGGVGTSTIAITTWDGDFTGSNPITLTFELASPHGLTDPTEITIDGTAYRYNFGFGTYLESISGVYVATPTSSTEFTIQYNKPAAFFSMVEQYQSIGSVTFSTDEEVALTVTRPNGYVTDERPTACAWYAGRAWFFGVRHHKLADSVFFSRQVEGDKDLGTCYQENDPTAEVLNALTALDGGVLKVPGLNGVYRAEVLGNSLVIFSSSGVWEIRGPQGMFVPTSFMIRKVTDAEAVSAQGITRIDSGMCFVSKRGLFVVQYDTNSGLLSAGSITTGRVDNYWGAVPDPRWAQAALGYDDAKKRVYTLVGKNDGFRQYDEALVYDFRLGEGGGYYKLSLPASDDSWVAGCFGVESGDNPTKNRKMKFVALRPDGVVQLLDMDHSVFEDEFGEEVIPYWNAAYDVTNDETKSKRINLYMWSHVKRTVTHYEDNGIGFVPANPGGATVQIRWDWADASISGKWGTPHDMYREIRMFTPESSTDLGGELVIARRHKPRGEGKVANAYVLGETAKDSHILGWTIQYEVINGR